MSAGVITRSLSAPRGATAIERASIRMAEAMTRWATGRAERRQHCHETMLTALQEEQTRKSDPRAVDHALAQMGMRLR